MAHPAMFKTASAQAPLYYVHNAVLALSLILVIYLVLYLLLFFVKFVKERKANQKKVIL